MRAVQKNSQYTFILRATRTVRRAPRPAAWTVLPMLRVVCASLNRIRSTFEFLTTPTYTRIEMKRVGFSDNSFERPRAAYDRRNNNNNNNNNSVFVS